MTPDGFADLAVPDASTLDARWMEAAAWRLHRVLARHWLHALRGSLNAMSLNIVLLGGDGHAVPGGEKAPQALRAYVRELDTGLTRFLDQSWLDEAPEGTADASAILASVRTLLEPLAKRVQVRIETTCPDPGPTVALDARTVHTVLTLLLADAIDRSPSKTTLTVSVRQDFGSARVEWSRVDAAPRAGYVDAEVVAAALRVVRRGGGEVVEDGGGVLALSFPLRSFVPGGTR
jgi:signal transduction histidine kinase